MKLYLIRHAQSEGNKCKSTYYKMLDWQVPLTDEGIKQAEKVGIGLKTMRFGPYTYPTIISSPYVRALDTANIIVDQFKYGEQGILRIKQEPLIREREWGNLREEVESFETREERNHLFDFYRRPVGGESFADCYQRAFIFFEHLKTYEEDSKIIIVSHGEFLKLLLMIIDGKTVEEFNDLPNIKNCEIIERNLYV